MEHVAEGQENNRGLLRGVLEEVMGSQKNFIISEKGDRGGSQKTITPSSLRYQAMPLHVGDVEGAFERPARPLFL